MATGGIDLKTLLEHDLRMAQSILDTSRKLVLELDAAHYWTTTSIDTFKSLNNICSNVSAMLDACQPEWAGGPKKTGKPEELKLWKTAAGLHHALPAEQKRFNEQVTRRRRQRIMGDNTPEDIELADEIIARDNQSYNELAAELEKNLGGLIERIETLPAGLAPPAEPEGQPASGGTAPAPPTLELQPQPEEPGPGDPDPEGPGSEDASAGDVPL